MKIKVEPYMIKRGNRVGKASIEFDENDSILAGFHLVGFTICEDENKHLFLLFPSSSIIDRKTGKRSPYFFLKPSNDNQLQELQDAIVNVYNDMKIAEEQRKEKIINLSQK